MSYRIAQDVTFLRGISVTQKVVLNQMAHYANDTTCECWPSQGTLADYCSLTRTAVNLAIKGLISKGLVTVEGWHGRARKYKLHVPSTMRSINELSRNAKAGLCDIVSADECPEDNPDDTTSEPRPVNEINTNVLTTLTPAVNEINRNMLTTLTQIGKVNREVNRESEQVMSLSLPGARENISNTRVRAHACARGKPQKTISLAAPTCPTVGTGQKPDARTRQADMAAIKGIESDNLDWLKVCWSQRVTKPPTFQEVEAYAKEMGYVYDGDKESKFAMKFYLHYQGIGWVDKLGCNVERWRRLMNKWWLTENAS